MPTTYSGKNPDILETIIKSGGSAGVRKRDVLTDTYVRQFYQHVPPEFLTSVKPAFLYRAAAGSFAFIQDRNAQTPRRVRVFNPSVEEHGWHSTRTIVELNTDDSPFLLDSVTAEIGRHRLSIYEVMHPILRLKRDAGGHITQLFDADNGVLPKGAKMESSMQFQITHIADDEERARLQRDIELVLQFVNLAVSDWHAIETRTQDIIRYVEDHKRPFSAEHVAEVSEFLTWLLDRNFIFLGLREYDFVDTKGKRKLSSDPERDLGIFRAEHERGFYHDAQPRGLLAIPDLPEGASQQPTLLEISKSSRKSIVHRPVHMDYIGIKRYNDKGEVIGEFRLLGLFTSAVYYQSVMQIPMLRSKIAEAMRRSGFPEDSHSGKSLLTVMEAYPRDEMLQVDEDELFQLGMGIVSLSERPRTKLFVRRDRFERFVSCIVFVPRDRFNTQLREKMQRILENAFGAELTDYYTQVTGSPLARIHYFLRLKAVPALKPDFEKTEALLEEASTGWITGLRDSLIRIHEERTGERLFLNYVDAFPESFKSSYHFGGVARDILKIEEAYRKNDVTLDFYQREDDDPHTYHLKLFHPVTQVMLSDILPILEHLGFKGLDERTFFVTPSHQKEGLWVHHFRLKVSRRSLYTVGERAAHLTAIKPEFEEALIHIWHSEVENDGFNKLIMRAGLKWRDVVLLRAFGKYIVQTSYPYSFIFTAGVMGRNPEFGKMLVELFHARFAPGSDKNRDARAEAIVEQFNAKLVEVKNVAEDRVLRQFLDTIRATLRTNFFQKDAEGKPKRYVSFKLNSAEVPNLPSPRPHAEIFVYAPEMEGIHLRGGKVARGGLRWSDRAEDFRTEVLGLVKAQMVKNAVIVPVGSKGGFVVKRPIEGDHAARLFQGKEAYRTFLRGLLDITDNIVSEKLVPPKDVVRHDGDDPYLVVAADKGTATFSDIANGISADYGFWLGDAFASGGSAGYDHKVMAITARGAWVSVERHFRELGVDIAKEAFTVAGIGDMSGDVFGNGMLLSKHIRLVAAFNHMHIFLDPEPDTAESFKERSRLFKLPRSTWEDYDKKLISAGGGIYSRAEKSIPISKQVRTRLGITKDKLTPDELVRAIITAPVDLLWNGGIGTYVKAASERDTEVGDRANDAVRANGHEVRARVVGEGGNLGFTQRGRIEYALSGGKINTDAIDNSGGVDCSDHEVNIKIALGQVVQAKKMTLAARNKLLEEMTDDVAKLVLRDNFLQTQVLSIAEQRGYMILEANLRLIRYLESEKKVLDRAIEFLPTDEEIAERQAEKKGLTRPEMAVILAYAKLDIFDELVHANLPDDDYFNADLLRYFPEKMRTRFRKEIETHRLKREIVATVLANSIVNRMGCTFFFRMKEDTGMRGCDVARAYTVVRDAFGLRGIWDEIEGLHTKLSTEVQAKLYLDIRRMVERTASWFLRNSTHPLNTGKLVSTFSEGIATLEKQLDRIIPPSMQEAQEHTYNAYVKAGVPQVLARRVAGLEALSSACDIVHVAKGKERPLPVVGRVYYELGTRLRFNWLREKANGLWSHSHWDNLGVQAMLETLYDQQMTLSAEVVRTPCKKADCSDALSAWEAKHGKELGRYDRFLADIVKQEKITQAMLAIAIQRVSSLSRD